MNNYEEFLSITYSILREEAITLIEYLDKPLQVIFKLDEICTFEVLCQAYDKSKEKVELIVYILALITRWICEISPLDTCKALEFFDVLIYFLQIKPEYTNQFWQYYGDSVFKQVLEAGRDDLLKWVEKIKIFRDVAGLQKAIRWIRVKMVRLCYEYYKEFLNDFEEKAAFLLIENLAAVGELKLGQNEEINYFTALVLNDFNNECIENDKKARILCKISELFGQLSEENKENFEGLNQKFRIVDKLLDISACNTMASVSSLIDGQKPIYNRLIPNNYEVSIYKVQYQKESMVIKVYSKLQPGFDLSIINTEISILTKLSELSSQHPLFLKFYGASSDSNNYFLFMEYGGINLKDYLSSINEANLNTHLGIAEIWTKQLLNSFSLLATYKIFHCDIKPQNLLVNSENILKIIDFNISQKYESYENQFDSRVSKIQGTEGYLAPELEMMLRKGEKECMFDPEKSDVYSLGLTLLEIFTLKKYDCIDFGVGNQRTMQIVDNVKCKLWIKRCMKAMLNADKDLRPSFSRCLEFIPHEGYTQLN